MPSPENFRLPLSNFLPLLCLGMLLGLTSGCYYDNEEELYQNIEDTTQCDTSEVTFQQTVDPIISTNCAVSGCHAGTSPTAGLNLEVSVSFRALPKMVSLGDVLPAAQAP